MENNYLKIAQHYSSKFEEHGATPQGLDWSNQVDVDKRYEVMLELLKNNFHDHNGKFYSILDFGCGYGGFYKYLSGRRGASALKYTGIDINENLIKKARELYSPENQTEEEIKSNKYPGFGLIDINSEEGEWAFNNPRICGESWDYIIINGVFTIRNGLTQEEMWDFTSKTLLKLWNKCSKGLAVNFMSKILDYERDDLFHMGFDELGKWIYKELGCSKFQFRQDYGLREFTTYLYK